MERKYICSNGVIERTRYAVGDNAQPRRGRRKGASSARKQEQNYNSALRRLARALNCNCNHDSLLITLDYSAAGLAGLAASLDDELRRDLELGGILEATVDTASYGVEPEEESREELGADHGAAAEALRQAAEKDLSLWLRRVRRVLPGKYIAVTSNLSPATGELVRVHHHVILMLEQEPDSKVMERLQRAWKLGGADVRRLWHQQDYTPLAAYLMAQASRVQPDAKKYRVSVGLAQPRTQEREILAHTEIKAPPGANVMERSEYSAEVVGQYIRYIPRPRKKRQPQLQPAEGADDGV